MEVVMRAWALVGLLVACSDDGDGDGFLIPDDCDDANADAFPGATEVCDGADNDCDGITDPPSAEGTTVYYIDRDGDGFGTDRYDRDGDGEADDSGVVRTCSLPYGYSDVLGDCDDDDAAVFPGSGC